VDTKLDFNGVFLTRTYDPHLSWSQIKLLGSLWYEQVSNIACIGL